MTGNMRLMQVSQFIITLPQSCINWAKIHAIRFFASGSKQSRLPFIANEVIWCPFARSSLCRIIYIAFKMYNNWHRCRPIGQEAGENDLIGVPEINTMSPWHSQQFLPSQQKALSQCRRSGPAKHYSNTARTLLCYLELLCTPSLQNETNYCVTQQSGKIL